MTYTCGELASKIYLYQCMHHASNNLAYSWTITTENEGPMMSWADAKSIDGTFITTLINYGNSYFGHIPDWRKKVEIISAVPREEIIIKEDLSGKLGNFDVQQKGLNPGDLEKALKLIRG